MALSKRDIEYVSLIENQAERNRITKKLEAKRAAGAERSARAFSKLIASRKERRETQLAKELGVEIKMSKRGQQYVVVDGPDFMSPIWLSADGCLALVSVITDIKNMSWELSSEEVPKDQGGPEDGE